MHTDVSRLFMCVLESELKPSCLNGAHLAHRATPLSIEFVISATHTKVLYLDFYQISKVMSYDGGIIQCFLFPRFIEDLTDMLGFAPSRYYYYMWKYISPLMLLTLLIASIVNMGLSPPGYNAWIEEKVKCKIKKLFFFLFLTF